MKKRIVLLALAAPFVLAAPLEVSATKAPPAITATPDTNLSDGQYVLLAFSGFAPGTALAFRQCIAAPATIATDCTPVNTGVTGIVPSQHGASGGFVYLPVYASGDPQLTSDNGQVQIACDQTHPCVIAGFPTGVSTLTGAILVPVTFAAPPSACPQPDPASSILGGASSSAYRAMYAWESTVCNPPHNLPVGYAVTNSVDGITNFLNPPSPVSRLDFAVSGPLATPPPQSPTTFQYAPLTASGLVLAFQMFDFSGAQITKVTLSPATIAQIFTGQDQNWNADPAITSLNPGVHFPSIVRPFVRADHSSQTFVFTSWLNAVDGNTWAGSQQTSTPQDIFPSQAAGVTEVTGSTNLVLGVRGINPRTDFSSQGNIGFMDSSTAAFYGLPTVSIAVSGAPNGSAATDGPNGSIEQAFKDATAAADGTLQINWANPDPAAYPIPMPTYLLAPTNTITGKRGLTLAAFLEFAVSATGGQAMLPAGYAPLPANLAAIGARVATAIPTHDAPPAALSPPFSPQPLPALPAPRLTIAHATPPPVGRPATRATPAPQPVTEVAAPAAFLQASQSRLVLPAIFGLAVLGIVSGTGIQLFERRRRDARDAR